MPSAVASSASSIEPRVSSGSSSSRPSSRTRTPWRRSSSVSLRTAAFEQAEQARDLVVGARPVLAAEGVQRQDRHAAPDGVAEDLADGLDAGGMPLELGQAVLAGPAAVAVHDDRHVARQLVGRQERGLRRLARAAVSGMAVVVATDASAGSWRSAARRSAGPAVRGPLDLEDLLFLRGAAPIDLGDVPVGRLLEESSWRCASSAPTVPSRSSFFR